MSITVKYGDTLSGIAARHKTTVSALMKANNISNANRIYAGQKLNLPGAQDDFKSATTYTVRSGDTLGAIGARFGVSYQSIAQANGISNPNRISVGQKLKIPGKTTTPTAPKTTTPTAPKTTTQTYRVRSGDTLSGIAARYGVTYQSIAQANGIANPNNIRVGQNLTIPNGKAPTNSNSTPVGNVTPTAPGSTKGGVTSAQLRAIMPNLSQARADQLLPHLNKAMIEGGINTPKRQAAFLAQLAHESVGLTAFEEYASGAAYEGRRDLGNIYPGDGVRYKGRGPIQLTGRANYRAAGNALGIDLENNPKRASDPDVGFRIAVWFWNSRNLSASADAGNFDYITYRINGGYNGKADRDRYHARARNTLGC